MIGEAGVCSVHNIPLLYMGREDDLSAGCVKCAAAKEPKLGRTQTIADPGAEFFGSKAGNPTPSIEKRAAVEVKAVFSFDQSVTQALSILRALPMPKDVKQFKLINKVITQLESLITEDKSNG